MPHRYRGIRGWAGAVVAGIVFCLAVLAVLYWLPLVLTRHPRPSRAVDILAAQNAARTSTIGVLVVIGTAVTASIAWRSHVLNRGGQYTDRYSSAIDQLGSDIPGVRLGGIYALAAVARDSRDDAPTVIDVLAAFVRNHPAEPDQSHGLLPLQAVGSAPKRSPQDIEAAVRVLGRIHRPLTTRPVDVRAVNLASIEVPGAVLSRVWLHQSDMRRSRLTDVDLSNSGLNFVDLRAANCDSSVMQHVRMDGAKVAGASFVGSDLRGAKVRSSDLTAATLINANLEGADLSGSILRGARFDGARLTGAGLRGVDLTGAVLTGAILDGADLRNARLTGARLDRGSVTSEQLDSALDVHNVQWGREHPLNATSPAEQPLPG